MLRSSNWFKLYFQHFSWLKSRLSQILANPMMFLTPLQVISYKFLKNFPVCLCCKTLVDGCVYQHKFLNFIVRKNKVLIKNFFSKCDQLCSFLGIFSHLRKKSLMTNNLLYSVTSRNSYNNYSI